MSKQSRARSRRHKKGTDAAAVFEKSIRYMPEARLHNMLKETLDELHRALCDRRTFKDREFLDLFYLRYWDELETKIVLKPSTSNNRTKALELIPRVRIMFSHFNDKGMNV